MNDDLPIIKIKAKTNKHSLFLIFIAFLIFTSNLLLSQYFWSQFRLICIFVYLLSLVIFIIGVYKMLEPNYSFYITPDFLQYFHRYGCWKINWDQIQGIHTINETVGLSIEELPYMGIRLTDIELLIGQISPRLANRLIHEQRVLLTFSVMHKLLSLEQAQLNFEPYKLRTGELVKGPVAAFLHHCEILKQALGYHLYIPAGSVDRDRESFCQLLKQCKLSANNYV